MFSPLWQITGWFALVIASAGPLPLWIHHALLHTEHCHAHGGLEQAAHCHAGQSHGSHSHGGCSHSHAKSESTPAGKSEGLHGTSDGHDCSICYQLSQAAASAVVFSIEGSSLPPTASNGATREAVVATLCGWPSPRGPPAA